MSDTDSTSTSEDDDSLFFGPAADESIAEKRAHWKRLLGEGASFIAGRPGAGKKKRRKTEERPRDGRYSYIFDEGDPHR